MVVIGLGSGRSGTASLSLLLNEQPHSICFHELNPSCVCYEGTPQPILNTISEFGRIVKGGDPRYLTVDMSRGVAASRYEQLKTMSSVDMIGDIAHYYLRYVDEIIAHDADVKFVCLKRNREKTIASWQRRVAMYRWPSKWLADRLGSWIMRQPFHKSRNPWMEHDGSEWAIDPVWDKCFPKYDAPDMESAIAMYWDDYYERANVLKERHPGSFIVVKTEDLDTPAGQKLVLDFLERPVESRVAVDAHIHKSA